MRLKKLQCDTAKPKDKPYKLADGGGLHMLIQPNGSKYWRLKYRFLGKEKQLALGTFPSISLAQAREAREDAKKLLREGIDPSAQKQKIRRGALLSASNTFEKVARECPIIPS